MAALSGIIAAAHASSFAEDIPFSLRRRRLAGTEECLIISLKIGHTMKDEVLKISQTSVAQALAADYFCIYYVNVDNDKFIEYHSSPEFRTFGLPTIGDDFITFSRKNFDELIFPEDQERFLETFTKGNVIAALDAHGYFTMTFRLVFGGVPTYVHLKATRMIEKEGHHMVIGISSVDDQMKARDAFEKAHHASVTYSRIAQALAEDYFCIYYVDMSTDRFLEYSSDDSYKSLDIEKTGEDFFGTSRKNILRIMHEEDQGAFLAVFTKENMQKVLDEHKTFTLSYRLIMGGMPTYVSLKATRMKDDDGNHVIIGVNNIDGQMKQQAEYMRAREDRITFSRVAQALAGNYFSIYVVDPDTGAFAEYSATEQYAQLGTDKAGADFFWMLRNCAERIVFPGDRDRFLSVFSRENVMSILERDGIFTTKFQLMLGADPVYVSMKATLMEDSDGRHIIIGMSNIDAQIRRELEYQRKMADARTAAKNDFLANMSHDIRTPMNAIVGYTSIANSHLDDPAVVRDSLAKIGSSSHFLLSLINDILDISKIESGKMQLSKEPCDLAEIFRRIEDITALQAQSKSLKITYQHSSIRHFRVIADELRIEQILINIISNAIKYTPEGRSVDLIAEESPTGSAGRNKYRFIVRDTGIGISEEYLPHIFESFTREQNTKLNRVQGTGLGLAITAKVVELMGGTISVKSKVGEGSEFTVELDLEPLEEAARASTSETEKSAANFAGHKVLLVEDNEINAEIATIILEQYGLTVDRALNGQEGVEKVRESGAGYYSAVLMDIQMPVMNGLEAARAIRTLEGGRRGSLPIIAMSANAYDEDVRDCQEAGMDAHLAKPFDPEDLARVLERYILGLV